MANKPKPTKLKLLQGNPGKRKIDKSEPQPVPEIPEAPGEWVVGELADLEWQRVVPELHRLGLLTKVDRAAIVAYCELWARWREAEAIIADEGLTIKTSNGNVIQHPAVGIANTALREMRAFLVEFGMSPSSRTKVSTVTGAKPADPWEALAGK